MPFIRGMAFRILRGAACLAPGESRRWADAMLNELDYVEGDVPALRWALGGAMAIGRHALIQARVRVALVGALLLLIFFALASSRGMSSSQPANGIPHTMTRP